MPMTRRRNEALACEIARQVVARLTGQPAPEPQAERGPPLVVEATPAMIAAARAYLEEHEILWIDPPSAAEPFAQNSFWFGSRLSPPW